MKLLEQFKLILPVGAVMMAIAGFYFSTGYRLDDLEEEITALHVQDEAFKKQRLEDLENELARLHQMSKEFDKLIKESKSNKKKNVKKKR